MASRLGLGEIAKGHASYGRWIVIGIGVLFVILIGWWLFGSSSATEFVTQDVVRQPLSVTVSATGTLAPRNEVDVGAEISGRLDAVLVDFNSVVKKGQVLARINTDQIEAQLAQARATLSQAEATLRQDSATIRRYRALRASNALSPQEYDVAQGEYGRAQSGVAMARAQVKQYETQLSKAIVRSPIDGIVLDRKVEPGQTVVAAMQTPVLFTLASDLKQMELDVDIDEADVGSIRPGQQATFAVDAYPARNFAAKLVDLHSAPKTVQGVVTYQGVLLVDNGDRVLKPGMTATAEIQAAHFEDVLVVPNGALRYTPPEKYTKDAIPAPTGARTGRVWVQSGSSIEPRDLTLGATDGRFTQVVDGPIEAGDKVVTDIRKKGDDAQASK